MDARQRHRLLTEDHLLRIRMIRANPGLYAERRIWASQALMIARQAGRLTRRYRDACVHGGR
jgi:hypothetical protein